MKKTKYLLFAAGTALFVLLFVCAQPFFLGIKTGLSNCAQTLIPSMFPFLVASSLVGSGDLPKPVKRLFEPLTQALFRLPCRALPAIVLSQVGGYLSGAKAVQTLCERGALTRSQGARLMLFGINSGLGFTVNAVGSVMLGSKKIGGILLFSLCVSSLLTGILTRFVPEISTETKIIPQKKISFSDAIVESVSQSSEAMLCACGFVCFFSGFSGVLQKYIKNQTVSMLILCFAEITSGCFEAAGKAGIPFFAGVCAFGGLCVHLQIFTLVKEIPINFAYFYLFRFIHAALSYGICAATLHFVPIDVQVGVSLYESARLWSFSAPAAVSLLFLSALLILDLDNTGKIC